MEQKIKQLEATLQKISTEYEHVCFSSSLSAEDMIITHLIAKNDLSIEVFTLDTGRLHEETYQLMQTVQDTYHQILKTYYPAAINVEVFVNSQGPNAFYQSVDARKTCCSIRKVEPLKRALNGKDVWVTGLRREQSVTRDNLAEFIWDDNFSIHKSNPLLEWNNDEVWQFIKENNVPYNKLHDQGYPSIGCSPCTRAIATGEDERAGRWWWESPESKECGLHVNRKTLHRQKDVA